EVPYFPIDGDISAVAFAEATIWAGPRDGIVEREGGNQRLMLTDQELPSPDIRALLADGDLLYIGTAAGLMIFNRADESSTQVDAFNGTIVSELVRAPDGSIWIGAHRENDVGFGMVGQLNDGEWRFWRQGDLPSVEDAAEVYDIAVDTDGTIWLATNQYDAGIYRFDGESWQGWPERLRAPVGDITAFSARGPVMVAGGMLGSRLALHIAGRWVLREVPPITGDILDLYTAPDESLWVATDDGLVRLEPRFVRE
ncbi:MAG TPA: two-component regulator propeller domain-containing protein, partial [Roseiflexaceae bacterium]|nr:two-component regulator propeller domain-containing protein [Roseiflexaceae bacterium]